MDLDFLRRLTSRDTLMAVGFSLFVFGLVLRGLAREHQRTLARRKQHELDTHQPGQAAEAHSHLDRHFRHYANGVTVLGVVFAIAAFFR